MKCVFTIAFAFLLFQSGFSQTKEDVVACLELAFTDDATEQLVKQEWGEVRTVYIVYSNQSQIPQGSFVDLVHQLDPQDFQGFPYEVVVITMEQRQQIDLDQNELGRAFIDLHGQFRGNNILSMNFGGPLPGNLRKHLLGSYVFEREADGWKILQSQATVNP
jgi:hypothetical protein